MRSAIGVFGVCAAPPGRAVTFSFHGAGGGAAASAFDWNELIYVLLQLASQQYVMLCVVVQVIDLSARARG